ncbi:serine hydrolase domain-containing protein [Streptomyces sp. NPDC017082]|uniref:serine hydrolase domain-containing protein n=1 Tax=Streptomyces sp. NPDC017082 TaxID=3364974 RepID=UPI00379F3031
MRRTPTCILSSSAAPATSAGHALDRFVEIGSLTKILTGTALIRMEATGLLSLEDPLEHWLPAPPGTGITLRHLAEHTSGLPRLPPCLGPRRDPYATFDAAALHTLLNRLDTLTVRPPGQEEAYSNFGYAVLGAALTTAADKPYEHLLRDHVLGPLGIDEMASRPASDHCLLAPGLLGGHRRPWTMHGAILPAGGMWATPRAAAELVTGLLVERKLGPPAPSWRSAGPLLWHNGATRTASVFCGAMPDGRWVLIHRLNGSPDYTDKTGMRVLAQSQPAQQSP